MATLYRAYRPKNFQEIVNQNHIKITLGHEISTGRLAHAYLFCGPRGIGKTTVARIFAKSLNCTSRKEGEHEPCNTCDICKDSDEGRNLDLIEIDAASHTGVDNVRENIISVARMAPSRSKYKVFIIDEVHMLSISAFNALLKLMEEPPKDTLFILCTTEAHKIPDTIISRTERFDFKRISANDIVGKLQFIINKEGIKIDRAILENIARQSGGHMRDAESLLGQVVAIGGKEVSQAEADLVIPRSNLSEVIELIGHLAAKDAGKGIELLNRAIDDGISLKRFMVETLEILRKMLIMKVNQGLGQKLGLELGESMELRVSEIAAKLDAQRLIRMIELLLKAQADSRASFIEHLPIEIAIVELSLPDAPVRPVPQATATQPMPARPQMQTQVAPAANQSAPVAQRPAGKPVSRDEIFARWNEVLARVKSQNHSLSFILRACQPTAFDGQKLCLSFKYKFHKDRISEPNIKQLVERVIQEVYGQLMSIEAVVDESLKVDANAEQAPLPQNENGASLVADAPITDPEAPAPAGDEDMLNNVLKAFGGKVV